MNFNEVEIEYEGDDPEMVMKWLQELIHSKRRVEWLASLLSGLCIGHALGVIWNTFCG